MDILQERLDHATGELCFNTGMTGYQEVFTDPSYSRSAYDHNKCSYR